MPDLNSSLSENGGKELKPVRRGSYLPTSLPSMQGAAVRNSERSKQRFRERDVAHIEGADDMTEEELNSAAANYSRPRTEWFVPDATTIRLPWGETLEVEGIPFEGWGTQPGKWNYVAAFTEDGRIAEYRSWEVVA